jgi:hypothetical protein
MVMFPAAGAMKSEDPQFEQNEREMAFPLFVLKSLYVLIESTPVVTFTC